MPKFSVRKSITIASDRDTVRAKVRDFKSWPEWSPWLIAEPGCTLTYTDDGKGYGWEGEIIGAGHMQLTQESDDALNMQLSFLKPFKSQADVRFELGEVDGGTELAWTMDSAMPWFMFWMVKMMVAKIGMDYERGLLMLKDLLETGGVPSRLDFKGRTQEGGFRYIGARSECAIPDVGEHMEADMRVLSDWIAEQGVKPSGPFFSIYHNFDMVKGRTEYTVGFPVEEDVEASGNLLTGELPVIDAYSVEHTGPYRHLGNAWSATMAHGRAKVFRENKTLDPFETYMNMPGEVDDADLVTVVHIPMK